MRNVALIVPSIGSQMLRIDEESANIITNQAGNRGRTSQAPKSEEKNQVSWQHCEFDRASLTVNTVHLCQFNFLRKQPHPYCLQECYERFREITYKGVARFL